MRTAAALLLATVATMALLSGPVAAASPRSRVSFVGIEDDLMCVACHESLAVAQSPEAFSERAYVRELIAQGLSKSQIERDMVGQYGPAVLAKPPASGFNLLIYILPPAVLVIGLATLAYTLPKWRRRSREAAAEPMNRVLPLNPDDARRLDEDLARRT